MSDTTQYNQMRQESIIDHLRTLQAGLMEDHILLASIASRINDKRHKIEWLLLAMTAPVKRKHSLATRDSQLTTTPKEHA